MGEGAAIGEESALVELGAVTSPHGIRGWVKVRSDTEPPERLFEHRKLRLKLPFSTPEYRVEATGRSGGRLTLKFAGVDDRDGAVGLAGASICVPRDMLPARSARDHYRADLIGCEAVDLAGTHLGSVQYFVETPAHAVMVIRGAKEFWIPAVPQHIRRVDLDARRVVVDWTEAAE